MTESSRNAPCPCGSGKKYKHCCLGRAEREGLAYSRAERERALEGLIAFIESPELSEITDLGVLEFWDGLQNLQESEAMRISDESAEYRCLHWILFDYAPGQETMVSRYLAHGPLTLGERTWLERMSRARVRLYEVRVVRKDQGLTLRDLWNEQVIEVRERLATHQLAPWDLLAARIIEGEHGHLVMEGTPWIFAPMQGPPLMKELRRLHKELRKHEPGLDEDTFFRHATLLFQDFWFDEVATVPLPQLATTDGDELTLARVTFEVTDAERAKALLREAGFEDDEQGRLAWLDRNGRRVLGDVVFEPDRCVLEVLSEPRARKGRRLLEKLLGSLVKHRSTVMEDAWQAAERATRSDPPPELPPEEMQTVAAEFLANYYHSWLDEPVPALGGRTPRHAVRLKTQRPILVSLLKQIEGSASQQNTDVSFLWTELGLPRE